MTDFTPGGLRSVDGEEADRAKEIEQEISSDQSPVGIDAKKTHVMILVALERIEARLDALEKRVAALEP
ncbi:MAG: hypothetical protein ACR2QM_00220 [Longimicrobiales bacterium]